MREAAAALEGWAVAGRRSAFARVVQRVGFGGGSESELIALGDDGKLAGNLLSGAGDEVSRRFLASLLEQEAHDRPARFAITVDGDAAAAAGLSCGGQAVVVAQRADPLPGWFWTSLASSHAVALATLVEVARDTAAETGTTSFPRGPVLAIAEDGRTEGSLGDAQLDAAATATAMRRLAAAQGGAEQVSAGPLDALVECFVPEPSVVVLGAGDLADAIVRQSAVLGWDAGVVTGLEDARIVLRSAGPAGALVVLSHDPDLDGPVIARAIAEGAFYLGALGSRRTQAARAERLAALGLSDADRARLHGPVGLDLGGRTQALVALAICAEIQSVRSGREPAPLRDTAGPIRDRPVAPAPAH